MISEVGIIRLLLAISSLVEKVLFMKPPQMNIIFYATVISTNIDKSDMLIYCLL